MRKFLLLMIATTWYPICFSQVKDFHFRRRISTPTSAGWYSIVLGNDLFKDLNNDISDLRIYQFTAKDTVESPYVLNVRQQQIMEEVFHPVAFNQARKGREQFFTLELPKNTEINFVELSFNETNFDGTATVEGSNDQKEWFEIARNQRIISIANQHLNFYSATIHFSIQRFRYIRVRVNADKELTLQKTTLKRKTVKHAIENKPRLLWRADVDKKAKQTIVKIELNKYQPVVALEVEVSDKADYYRPFRLEKITDSTSTPKGWQYFYSTIVRGYITSLDSNRFVFTYAPAKKMRLVIDNADNVPLNITSVSLSSPLVQLIARMTEGEHFLYYGNGGARTPDYDLANFQSKIPSMAGALMLGEEEKLIRGEAPPSALIQNKIWLWILIGTVIAVLGYFTVRMMKETP